jgi:sulfoxide reductase heme-binding subunit YedZ
VTANQTVRWVLKPVVFLCALGPFALLLRGLLTANLGADPLAELTNETGVWALRFLAAALAVTPVRRLTHWQNVIKFRRMLGLFAFFYGLLHLLVFIVFDRLASLGLPSIFLWQTFRDLGVSIAGEILKRPYITVGFTAWVILLALACTSTTGMIRRLGGRRWQALHRLVYVAAVAGVIHYWWLVKADIRHPQAYAATFGILLGFRVWLWARSRRPASVRAAPRRASATPASAD